MDFDGSFNIPPTSKAVIVYMNKENHYVFELLSFGLVAAFEKPTDPAAVKRGSKNGPAYSKEIQHGQLRHFNCRKETIANNKLLWVDSRKNLRCVVPIQGYFEWQKTKEKPVYYVTLKDRPLVFLAGLYSHNYNYNDTEIVKAGDEYLSSFSIVTGPGEGKGSNDLSWLHGRKPILLEPNTKEWDAWLTPNHEWDPKLLDTSLNHETNVAYDTITSYEVDKAIGNPQVNGPDNLKPVKKQQRGIGLFFKREPALEPQAKEEKSTPAETSVKEEPTAKEEAKDADDGDDVDEEELKKIEDDDELPDDGVEDVDDVEDDGAYDDAEAGGEGGDDGEDDDDDEDDDDAAEVQEEVEEIESDEEEDEDKEAGNVEVVEDEEDVGEKEVGGDDVEDEDIKAEKKELGEEKDDGDEEKDDDADKEDKPEKDVKADKAKADKGKKAAEEPLAGSKRKSTSKGSESKRKR